MQLIENSTHQGKKIQTKLSPTKKWQRKQILAKALAIYDFASWTSMIIEKQGKNNFEIPRQFFEIFPFIPSNIRKNLDRAWAHI